MKFFELRGGGGSRRPRTFFNPQTVTKMQISEMYVIDMDGLKMFIRIQGEIYMMSHHRLEFAHMPPEDFLRMAIQAGRVELKVKGQPDGGDGDRSSPTGPDLPELLINSDGTAKLQAIGIIDAILKDQLGKVVVAEIEPGGTKFTRPETIPPAKPPTLDQVLEECEKQFAWADESIDKAAIQESGRKFHWHWEGQLWRINGFPMKNWKSALRGWVTAEFYTTR